ncbi:hypothetical protein TrLO_g12217 [Triparma laevis f. longispina]|uniref:Uncharacterized protein n=1 Tax=Triparma laevis f. longispina TaxID=1714387 RepID=A0A9W7KXS4_9STRA|nr:hypothetical protein TrLO_g12217 [Triparma laevis f. longispina]
MSTLSISTNVDTVDPWTSPDSVVPVSASLSKVPSLPLPQCAVQIRPPFPSSSRYTGYKVTSNRSYLARLGYKKEVKKTSASDFPNIRDKRYMGYRLTTDRSFLRRLGYTGVTDLR